MDRGRGVRSSTALASAYGLGELRLGSVVGCEESETVNLAVAFGTCWIL
jgi:hypothetical protein